MSESTEKKIGKLLVRIDRSLCIGSANCVKVAGDLFTMDDEDIAVFAPEADAIAEDVILEGCRICPVEALSVTGPDGKQLVP